MKINPCLSCTGEKKDKNNPVCRKCKKRIAYIAYLDLELDYIPSYCETHPSRWPAGGLSKGISSISLKINADF
jgi:hypothetical protein